MSTAKGLCKRCNLRRPMAGGFLICAICFNEKLGEKNPTENRWKKGNFTLRRKKKNV